jgi:hypothetical protein
MTAEKSPLIAVGNTMRVAVCHGVAPAPSEAARRCVFSDRINDGNDREAHHEAHYKRVALDVRPEQPAARIDVQHREDSRQQRRERQGCQRAGDKPAQIEPCHPAPR